MALAFKQGSSIDLRCWAKNLADDRDLTDFTCRVVVKDKKVGKDGAALIDRVISTLSTDKRAFLGKLTPTETAALPVSSYWIMVELDNASTEENDEYHEDFQITQQGVS